MLFRSDFVEDRPRREQALGGAEGLFHHRQLLVAKHGIERREVGVGAQHEDAVELGLLGEEVELLGPFDAASNSLSARGLLLLERRRRNRGRSAS